VAAIENHLPSALIAREFDQYEFDQGVSGQYICLNTDYGERKGVAPGSVMKECDHTIPERLLFKTDP
jgi:hypothetical protein